jgi:glycosyltransferase involved in cell wall biosynthesis
MSWPAVSVVMPVVNEERHLAEAVDRVLAQGYPGELEVVIAVGPSSDRTASVAEDLERTHPCVHVVDNPTGRTPAGMNAAIRAARNDILVRVDGHGLLNPGYIQTAVRILSETGADNVGGVMAAEGTTPFQRAVALAMTSRLGIGGARFHTGGAAGPAETVYLGVFRRATLERLGGFDETFLRAQDWELNHRIRSSGGLVWFSPELSVTYRPRSSWKALVYQFARTGRWRREVIRRYPATASARYLAPPAVVVLVAGGSVLGVVGLATGTAWLTAGLALPAGYLAAVVAGSVVLGRHEGPAVTARLPAVIATMHLTWGAGFLAPVQTPRRRRRRLSRS